MGAVRFFFTCVFGLLIGAIYWRKGNKRCVPRPISPSSHPRDASILAAVVRSHGLPEP